MFRVLAFLLLVALPGSSGADHPSAESRPIHPGERLEFAAGLGPLSDVADVASDTLPAEGAESGVRMVATVRPGALVSTFYAFSYRHITTARYPDLEPRSASRQIREEDRSAFVALSYHHDRGYVGLSEQGRGPEQARDAIEPGTFDLLTGLFHLRTLDPSSSGSFSVYENRKLYSLSYDAPAPEEVDVPAGRRSAWHYVLRVSPPGTLTQPEIDVWIAEDESRAPLKLEAGTQLGRLELVLTRHRAATAPPPHADRHGDDSP